MTRSGGQDYDLIIIGGGLVGASLACALGDSPVRIAMIEAVPPKDPAQPSYDDRSTALAPSSQRIFAALDLWEQLRVEAAPIREIHVSDRGRWGVTRMYAAEEGLDALGWVVTNRRLGEVLPARAQALQNVDVICPATLEAVTADDESVEATVRRDGTVRRITGRLLAVADGVKSRCRELLGIEAAFTSYGQAAVICNLTPERDHRGRAFERFTEDGPLALLPAAAGRCALVWSVPDARLDAVLRLSGDAFLAEVQRRFGYRLGRLLQVGVRGYHSLQRLQVRHLTAQRSVLLGNAAHTLHPVAGQGFNLSLRDVATLAELVHEAAVSGRDPGRSALLHEYESLRQRDYRNVTGFTHMLVSVFGNDLPGLAGARNLGLLSLDLLPAAKRALIRQATGRGGRLPRLATGVPLKAADYGRKPTPTDA